MSWFPLGTILSKTWSTTNIHKHHSTAAAKQWRPPGFAQIGTGTEVEEKKTSDPRKKYKDSKSNIIQGSRGARPYSVVCKLFKYDKYVYICIYICMYQHLERGAKWFLKGINSLSLRVQLAPFWRSRYINHLVSRALILLGKYSRVIACKRRK